MKKLGKEHARIICDICRREKAQHFAKICTGCARSLKKNGGPRQCDKCKKLTVRNFSLKPKVICLDCFICDLKTIRDGVLAGLNDLQISRKIYISRRVIPKWRNYFYGGKLPVRENYFNQKTLAKIDLLRSVVIAQILSCSDRNAIHSLRSMNLIGFLNNYKNQEDIDFEPLRELVHTLIMRILAQDTRWDSPIIRDSLRALVIDFLEKTNIYLSEVDKLNPATINELELFIN